MKKATVNMEHEARMQAQTWLKARKGRLRMILSLTNRMVLFHDNLGNEIKGRITGLGDWKKVDIANTAEAILIQMQTKEKKENV